METQIKQLEELLAGAKYEEAKKLIGEMVQVKLSSEEKGAVLVGIASAYMDISNAINETYRDALKEVIASIELVDKSESDFNDKLKLEEVKKDLGI